MMDRLESWWAMITPNVNALHEYYVKTWRCGSRSVCLGLVMSVGALAGLYPHQAGSNIPNGGAIILFLAVFFMGELIGLFGLGVLIFVWVYRGQRGRSVKNQSRTRDQTIKGSVD